MEDCITAMASLIDSQAQFTQRCKEIGLSVNIENRLKAAGISSLGVLAYSHGQPGQALNEDSFRAWLRADIDPAIGLADSALVKRLLFEAHTLVLAALKEQVTAPEAAAAKKVPASEREAKMQNLRGLLTGLNIEGPTEPGHSLLDSCAQMFHLNEIRYLPPEKCVSRLHEVTHAKSPLKQLEIESDKLVLKEHQEVPSETAHSGLQVKEALERRGLGLVFADLITHASYTRYISALFAHLHRDPPAGYSRCSVSQLVSADRAVWSKLIEDGIKPKRDTHGVLPLDTALTRALESYQVSFALLPLPQAKKPNPKNDKDKDKDRVYNVWDKRHKGGKGKGKGKGSKGQKLPYGIVKLGGTGRTPDGENLCFKYNLEGCEDAADGATCPKGKHVCAKCFGTHGIKDHSKH